jgi:hypothetical protein
MDYPSGNPLILYVIMGVLAAIIVVIVIYLIVKSSRCIDADQCPIAAGNFGVNVKRKVTIINKCGVSGLGPCTFPAETLSDAIDLCNGLINMCDAFIYSSDNKSMSIINPTTTQLNGVNDLYTRQYPVIIT